MRRFGVLLMMVTAMAVGFGGNALAADVSAGADVVSAYVWRGITFNDEAVVQPYVDVTAENGININVWGNYDLGDYNETVDNGEFSEIDLTLSYGFSLDPVDITVGHIEYLFPGVNGDQGTSELFIGASVSPLEGLSAGIDFYYDYDEGEEYYTAASLSYDFELPGGVGIGLGGSAGYAGNKYAADGDHDFYDYNLSCSASYAVTDAVGVSAFIAYTDSFDDDNTLTKPDLDVDVYGGGGFSVSF
ncbi:MAG: MltA-interacting MipA family protein [Thermodesulfobacteriota bacterium]|nr:MltA-interacting MipA family protein [Thermodesulfobacteriota bacterium]